MNDMVRWITDRVGAVFSFYVDGFRSMTLGRTLWTIILIKLFIMFAILKIFFFPSDFAGKDTQQRSDMVIEQMIK